MSLAYAATEGGAQGAEASVGDTILFLFLFCLELLLSV